MIDWISCKLPIGNEHPHLDAGQHLILDHQGEIEKAYPRPLPLEGSHDSRLLIASAWHPGNPARRLRPGASYLYLSGNPIKFWQGHNLFGTDDLKHLLAVTAERVCALLRIETTPEVRSLWWGGWVPLTRVDSTIMLHYGSRQDVRAVIRTASLHSRSRHGAAQTRGGTVYLGLASRRWTLKLYSKGDELDNKSMKHQLPTQLSHRDKLTNYADTALRVELQLRGLELERRGLSMAAAWSPTTSLDVLREKLETTTMHVNHRIPSEILEDLPGRLVAVYEAWRAGHDLRALYSRTTFYRYRKQLLELGVDILAPSPLPDPDQTENVVPLNRVLEGVPATVPDWAKDTPLYFQPPRPLKAVGQ